MIIFIGIPAVCKQRIFIAAQYIRFIVGIIRTVVQTDKKIFIGEIGREQCL